MGTPKESNWPRSSRHSRGYGAEWDKTRKRILARDERRCRCAHCVADGRILPASEVDHIVPKAKALALGWTASQIEADTNLQAINADCHRRKTAEENGREYRPSVRVGVDGFPT